MTTQSPPALLNLSDLSQRIDIEGFYERHGCIVSGKPSNSREGREYACSCPSCGGVDRASFWESGRFCCVRGCRAKCSSPYWFLRDIEGLPHAEALEDLGIDQEEVGEMQAVAPRLPLYLISDEPPNKKWMESAHAFCQAAEKCLWSSKGETARAYLQSRGLTEATIKSAHLGLCPDWYKAPLEQWGLSAEQLNREDDPQIKIPRGIVIPWRIDGDIWKIQLRRPEGGYFEVLGSMDCLYSIAPIEPGRPVLLLESELDALSAHQQASDLVVCVATGGTPKGRNSRNVSLLKRASRVLQGFDDDEAGHRAATEWQALVPGTVRHTPWAHDVNDMLREDAESIREWVELGLEPGETLEEFWESCEPPALEEEESDILQADAHTAFLTEFYTWKSTKSEEYQAWLDDINREARRLIAEKDPSWSFEAVCQREAAFIPPPLLPPAVEQPSYRQYWRS